MNLNLRLACTAALAITCFGQVAQHHELAAFNTAILGSALITASRPRKDRIYGFMYTATLTTSEIVADVFAAFRKKLPAFRFFARDFSSANAKYGQQIIAHVAALPTAVKHDTTNGFFYSPTDTRGLLTDVPLTMDVWEDVILKINATDLVADQRTEKYQKAIEGAAYALGASAMRSVLAKVGPANLSYSAVCADSSATAAKLRLFSATLNDQGALGVTRAGLVSSGFMTGLLGDSIIASGDYFDQRQESGRFAILNNIAGFDTVMEMPDWGNIGTFTAVAATNVMTMTDSRKHGFSASDVVRFTTTDTLPAGLAINTSYYVIATGLTTTAFEVSATDGGAAIDITDTGTGTHSVKRYDLTGLCFEDNAIVMANRLPQDSVAFAQSRGIPIPLKVEPQTDPETGLSVLALERLNTGTLDVEICLSAMWGSAVGKQGGSAGALMDKAALRINRA